RRALQSVALQFFANGMVYGTFVPRLPEIRDRVDISVGVLGVVLMVGSVAGLLGSLIAGRVVARIGTKRVMIVGAVLSIGALPIVGWATAPVVLIGGLALVLFFDVFIDVAMNIQGSTLSARRDTPVMNRLHGLWSLGTVTAGVLAALATRADIGPPAHLTAVAIVLIGALLFVAPGLLPVDEEIAAEDGTQDGARDGLGVAEAFAALETGGDAGRVPDDVAVAAAREDTRPAVQRAAGAPRRFAWLLGAGGFAAMTLEVGNGDWAAFRLGDDLDAAPGLASAAFVAFTVGMTVGRFGGDFVQVRVGARRLAQAAALVAGIGSLAATVVPVVALAFAGFVLAGLGVSVLFPQLYDAAARAPGATGSGFASMLFGQRSATILVPLAIGALADTAALGVGDAMAFVLLPCAVVSFLASTAMPRTSAR
ncbi:MAG: MFS transporter, partial [Cytophagales bacterium]|nr:MFS transporter [Cytophagales bacterium]